MDLASLPPNWLQLALPGHTEEEEDTEQTAAPMPVDSETIPMAPPAAAGSETPPSGAAQVAPPVPAGSGAPVGPTQMAPRVRSGLGNPVEVARLDPPACAGSVAPVEAAQTTSAVPIHPGNRAGPSTMSPPPQTPRPVCTKPAAPTGPSQVAPPPVFGRPESPVAPARTGFPPLKRPAHALPLAAPPMSQNQEASARATQMAPRPPKPQVYPTPTNPGVAAQLTPLVSNRPATPPESARTTPPPTPRGVVPTIRGVTAETPPPESNRPAIQADTAGMMPPPRPPPMSNRPATPPDAARTMPPPTPRGAVHTNPTIRGVASQTPPPGSNRPATPPPPQPNGPVDTNPTIRAVAAQTPPPVSNRPVTPADAARMMPPPPPRRPVTNPSASIRPPTPAGAQTATRRPMNTRPMTPAGPAQMVSRPPPRPVGTNPATPVGSVMLLEANPGRVKPDVIRDIRERNRVALSVALDPRRDCTKINTCTGDEVWYVSSHACHHVSGNLDLLNNLSPVSDCWVRSVTPEIQLFQALARGSVNHNGIILDDVWYVPDMMNIVSTSHLCAQGLRVDSLTDVWTFKRFDESVAGRAHVGRTNLFEMDFINTSTSCSSEATWYLLSSAQEHMTGNLELLSDYRLIRPSRAVRTHTGSILQVCGKGSLKKANIFFIPDVSFVPGLDKNIISVSQLADSGYSVRFERNGCKIVRRDTPHVVAGQASYGGEELIRLSSLKLDRPLPGEEPAQNP